MSALALMLHQMGHKVQGSDVENITSLNVVLSKQVSYSSFRWKKHHRRCWIDCWKCLFVKITTLKLLMQLKMATALSVTTSSWVTSWINSLALVWQVHMVRLLQQVSCHMLWKISPTRHTLSVTELEEVLLMHNTCLWVWWIWTSFHAIPPSILNHH